MHWIPSSSSRKGFSSSSGCVYVNSFTSLRLWEPCLSYVLFYICLGLRMFTFVQISQDMWPAAVWANGRSSNCTEIMMEDRLWSRSLSLSCLSVCVWVWQLQCSISCYWKQLFDTVWPSLSSFWFDPHSWTVLWTCLCVSSSRWSLGRRDGGYRDLYPAGLALRSGWSRTASPDPPYRRRRTGASCEYNHIIIQKANPHKYI